MKFYGFEAFRIETEEERMKREENRGDDRRKTTRESVELRDKSMDYANRLLHKTICFLERADEYVKGGIITTEIISPEETVTEYFGFLGIKADRITVRETTFMDFRRSLAESERGEYIYDEDDIMMRYDFDDLEDAIKYHRSASESILSLDTKAELYSKAHSYLAADGLCEELDRIYSVPAKGRRVGHPVHYILETDDSNLRSEYSKILLSALYQNGRVENLRYTVCDIIPHDTSMSDVECVYQASVGGSVIIRFFKGNSGDEDIASVDDEITAELARIIDEYSDKVLTVLCLPKECTAIKHILDENIHTVSFIDIVEEMADRNRAEKYLRMLAKESHMRPSKSLFQHLSDENKYYTNDLTAIFNDWKRERLKTSVFPQYKSVGTVRVMKNEEDDKDKGAAYDELMQMTGLDAAKKVIKRALAFYKAQSLFSEKGIGNDKIAMHMIFTGNPGTAKTSVARLFGRIMKENGIVSTGQFVEVGRGDLVGKYVGWTADIVKRRFKQAIGGVLFIDEAYSLVDDRSGSYGDEAINTIVQEMENHRDEVVVIFAGYPDEMEGFLNKNPGLASRIAFHVPFEDYNADELCDIAKFIACKNGLTLTDGAVNKLHEVFETAVEDSDFGNGRYVRNVIEKARMTHAQKLCSMNYLEVTQKDVTTIDEDDIDVPVAVRKKPVRQLGFCG